MCDVINEWPLKVEVFVWSGYILPIDLNLDQRWFKEMRLTSGTNCNFKQGKLSSGDQFIPRVSLSLIDFLTWEHTGFQFKSHWARIQIPHDIMIAVNLWINSRLCKVIYRDKIYQFSHGESVTFIDRVRLIK